MIYILDVRYLHREENYIDLYNKMPDFRKEKADKYRFMKDKACSVGAWGLLQYALSQMNIKDDTDVIYNEFGKPFLKNHKDIFFSLSHSENMVMCAISDEAIGCDIQIVEDRNDNIRGLAKRFFAAGESEYIESLPDDEAKDAFYRIWTVKESYIKATGEGLSRDLASFEVKFEKDIIKIGNEEYFCHEINDMEGYKAAYCTGKKIKEKVVFLKSLNQMCKSAKQCE